MTGSPKEKRGVGAALRTAELPARYRFSLLLQPVGGSRGPIRRCVSCGSLVRNKNLGGNDGRSALTGGLYCVRCADFPSQLLLLDDEGEIKSIVLKRLTHAKGKRLFVRASARPLLAKMEAAKGNRR